MSKENSESQHKWGLLKYDYSYVCYNHITSVTDMKFYVSDFYLIISKS